MKRCIVSVAFRPRYVKHSQNQIRKIKSENIDMITFQDKYPTRGEIIEKDIVTRFQQSLYGFKPHAIQIALDKGYDSIIWMDPSVLPTTPVSKLFDELEENDILVVMGEHKLNKMTSKMAFEWFKIKPEEVEGINHIGGTVYCFNFSNPTVRKVFDLWKEAEENDIFGNQGQFMHPHWADESCMALAMHKFGIKQKPISEIKYLNQKDLP